MNGDRLIAINEASDDLFAKPERNRAVGVDGSSLVAALGGLFSGRSLAEGARRVPHRVRPCV